MIPKRREEKLASIWLFCFIVAISDPLMNVLRPTLIVYSCLPFSTVVGTKSCLGSFVFFKDFWNELPNCSSERPGHFNGSIPLLRFLPHCFSLQNKLALAMEKFYLPPFASHISNFLMLAKRQLMTEVCSEKCIAGWSHCYGNILVFLYKLRWCRSVPDMVSKWCQMANLICNWLPWIEGVRWLEINV